jgi:hypothetical protein
VAFRFVDSKADGISGGNAYVVLESDSMRIRLIKEYGKLYIEFQSVHSIRERWFTWDVIRELLLHKPESQAILDVEGSVQLEQLLPSLESAFSASNYIISEARLEELERKRSQRLFGV